jgi:hypothetical protein
LVEVEQALTKIFNLLKVVSEFVLLLPNTDSFEQFADFVRACSTSTKYEPALNNLQILSELVLFLLNTDRLQQFENLLLKAVSI